MKYRAILIDADDTLFDFQRAERNAITAVLRSLNILEQGAPEAYSRINHACWQDFEKGILTQDALKRRRFVELIDLYSAQADPDETAEMYAVALSQQGCLIDGALDVVREIAAARPVAIVTNGIARIQHGRMDRTELKHLVSALIISEEVGCAKPDPRMIEAALDALGVRAADALMVGDSLTSDMRCAQNAGVDACWYNPSRARRPDELPIRYEISDIRDLPRIALG